MRLTYTIDIYKDENGLWSVEMKPRNQESSTPLNDSRFFLTYKTLVSFIQNRPHHHYLIVEREENKEILNRLYSLIGAMGRSSNISFKNIQNEQGHREDTHQALYNGFRLFLTGMYPAKLHHSKLKHLHHDFDCPISSQLKDRLNLNSNINSSQIGSGINRETTNHKDSWFGAGQLLYKPVNTNSYEVLVIESGETTTRSIKSLSYVDYMKTPFLPEKGEDVFLTIEQPKDYDLYSNVIEQIQLTGELSLVHVIPYLRDECKWSYQSTCSVTKETRISIGTENVLDSPVCFQLDDNDLLTRGDLFQLFKSRYAEHAVIADCINCPIVLECPRCIKMVPQSMEKDRYCSLRKSQPYVAELTRKKYILKSFFASISSNHSLSDIVTFSTEHCTRFYHGPIRTLQRKMRTSHFIFGWKDEVFLYSESKMKFYKIPILMAIYLEGVWLGESSHEIRDYCSDRFGMSEVQFNYLMQKADSLLRSVS